MAIAGIPTGFTRNSWEVTWMSVALDVARRSACTRAQCGAVIITPDNRLAGLGYNGPPRGLPITCAEACPRAKEKVVSDDGYETCISVHAECNAVLHSNFADRRNATMYVTTVMCMWCAKFIANSGISRVVMRIKAGDAHRQPERTIAFLQACQVDVQVWGTQIEPHRQVFFETHKAGPHRCYFCSEFLAWVEVVHHLDHNHENNDPQNLGPAHKGCHQHHHTAGRKLSPATIEKIRMKVSCPACGYVTNRSGMVTHRRNRNH